LRKRLKETLQQVLPSSGSPNVYNAFDIIGDIAITKVPNSSEAYGKTIAETIIHVHRSIKTVLVQDSPVAGNFRIRRLKHAAGENKTRTIHKENGCFFAVDVETCYFSPRLCQERKRIAQQIKPNETIVNMFAGVGCFSIVIAKKVSSAKVFSIDINPFAIKFMEENIRLNRVYGKVIPLLGDAKTTIENQLRHCADRVLMPLPEKAFEYLPYALSALKASGGWIHLHTFEHATKTEKPAEKVKQKVTEELQALGVDCESPLVRVVRSTGPNWWQLVADIHVR
jgi:tRNA (guanine37-N1)-methyltransferase